MSKDQYMNLMKIWLIDHQTKHSEEELKEAFAVFDKVIYNFLKTLHLIRN